MKISIRHIADHGTIAAAIEAIAADHDTLADKVAEPYKISDSNATGYAATLADAESIIQPGERTKKPASSSKTTATA